MSSEVIRYPRRDGSLEVELEIVDDGEEIHANAFLEGEYVGYLHLTDGLVELIEVEEEFRRRGVATELLKTVLEAGFPVEHNWANLLGDGAAWLESIEPEKVRAWRTWDSARRDAYARNEWDFPAFADWLARRPQLESVEQRTGVIAGQSIQLTAAAHFVAEKHSLLI